MPSRRYLFAGVLAFAAVAAGCAALPTAEPMRVEVVGFEPMPGQGLELRMGIKLRVLNPSDTPARYRGAFIEMDLRGASFAAGVSSDSGQVPAYGETVLTVPVSVSALNVLRQAIGLHANPSDRIDYRLRGRVDGPSGPARFEHKGAVGLQDLMPPPARAAKR